MMTTYSNTPSALIVGAGLAGLACGVELARRNIQFRIIEASDGPGGRVRTDSHPDGYLLDRGFQVILDAYPAFDGLIEIDSLDSPSFCSWSRDLGRFPHDLRQQSAGRPGVDPGCLQLESRVNKRQSALGETGPLLPACKMDECNRSDDGTQRLGNRARTPSGRRIQ